MLTEQNWNLWAVEIFVKLEFFGGELFPHANNILSLLSECGQSVAERMQLFDPWPAGFGQSLHFTTWLGCLDGYISAIDLTTF